MNPVSIQKKLRSIIGSGLPVQCTTPWGMLTGSFTSARDDVLLLTYGCVEDYNCSIIFTEGDFPSGTLPRKGDLFTVNGKKLFVMGVRQEHGISLTVDFRS